jgi:hypothetical protein
MKERQRSIFVDINKTELVKWQCLKLDSGEECYKGCALQKS